MTIVTVQFDYAHHNTYKRLVDVFRKSVNVTMPDVKFETIVLKSPGEKVSKLHSLLSNTIKLRAWKKWMDETNDNTVFMDCDMLVLKPIESAFDLDFDVAYTVRTRAEMPMNGGVVFVKPTDEGKRFIAEWLDVNERMYVNRKFHQPYRQKYAGMNQAAFGYLLENPLDNILLKPLPCHTWNACSEDWSFVNGKTKIVHYKSQLRKLAVMHMSTREIASTGALNFLVEIWRRYEEGENPAKLINALDMRNSNIHPIFRRHQAPKELFSEPEKISLKETHPKPIDPKIQTRIRDNKNISETTNPKRSYKGTRNE